MVFLNVHMYMTSTFWLVAPYLDGAWWRFFLQGFTASFIGNTGTEPVLSCDGELNAVFFILILAPFGSHSCISLAGVLLTPV